MINFKTIILGIGFIVIFFPAYCQKKSRETTGEYEMIVENNVALNDAISFATQQAQISAIENVFGKVISQENTSYIQNKQNGADVQSKTAFNFISNSYVKGEWVEDIDKPKIEQLHKENENWIKVTVHGTVREITSPENNFDAYVLSCSNINCKTQRFNDGQDFYLYFKSSVDGYVSVYLTDPNLKYTFMLLPYKSSLKNKKSVPIKADQEYIFFTKKNDYFNDGNAIDEQIISVGQNEQSEKYQVWILFSTDPLDKPVLEDESISTKKFLDEQSIKEGYTLQKGINEVKFREWLQGYRVYNKKVQLSSIFIDVNKM